MTTITSTSPKSGRKNSARSAVPRTNWPVFLWGAASALAITFWAFVNPHGAQNVLGAIVAWTADWFGWFYVVLAAVVLGFVIFVALSRFGTIKLGPEDSKPEFTTLEWASMLFAAGIGTDLMFFAVAEPVTQYLQPPSGPGETVQAAREATVWTLFHYGLAGWGMYALMGMALAYFAYRMRLPLAVRSALAPIFGKRIHGAMGDIVDYAALLGTIFGVATSLGIGVVMVNVGLATVFGVPVNTATQVAIVVVGVVVATLSAVSGVDKGIKFLSLLNVFLAIALSLWVLLFGNTQYLLEGFVLNVGDFLSMFPDMIMQTFAYEDTGTWMADWTLFFWAWWVAWASFVGLFLARISRGRTIRQFVAGTLTIPFIYVLMWISIFGNSALDIIRQGDEEFGANTILSPEGGFYELLSRYPVFSVMAVLATLTALLFYVTSADSAALVMANLSSRLPSPREDGRVSLRIFWATTTGALTIAVLLVGGIGALQSATVIMGLPFSFVMVLVMIALYRSLSAELLARDETALGVVPTKSGGEESTWQRRLAHMLTLPNLDVADEFETRILVPTLEEIAAEMTQKDVSAVINRSETPTEEQWTELLVNSAADQPFRYRVYRQEGPVPSYGTRLPHADDRYVRMIAKSQEVPSGAVELTVNDREAGDHNILGYTKTQIINDVLDEYQNHLEEARHG